MLPLLNSWTTTKAKFWNLCSSKGKESFFVYFILAYCEGWAMAMHEKGYLACGRLYFCLLMSTHLTKQPRMFSEAFSLLYKERVSSLFTVLVKWCHLKSEYWAELAEAILIPWVRVVSVILKKVKGGEHRCVCRQQPGPPQDMCATWQSVWDPHGPKHRSQYSGLRSSILTLLFWTKVVIKLKN